MKILKNTLLATSGMAMLTFASCEKEDSNNSTVSSADQSNFDVRMTDAPANYSKLDVEILSVLAYNQSEDKWVLLDSEAKTVNVIELRNGKEEKIASGLNVESGIYSKLKLVFGDNNKIEVMASNSNSTKHSYDLDWKGNSNEVIVDINENVDNENNIDGSVLIDFNIPESVDENENDSTDFDLFPVIRFVENENTGIQGKIESEGQSLITITDGNTTYSTYTESNGEFMIKGIQNGNYDLVIENSTKADVEMKKEDVVVINGQITNVGNIQFQ